ncbi:MAG TPA: restriction endonuclease subunit S [Thermoanaerobaculia bacterium]|nr:restriction endonuclease subunit S [Thermoanaerobaculia bacterium]
MIAGLRPYPEMRDSGVGWLGEVPHHWEVRRIKYLLRERNIRSTHGTEQLLRVSQFTGVTERKREDSANEPDTRAESLVGYKLVEPNDLVVNIMLAWNGSLGVSDFSGIASPAYCVYRLGPSVQPSHLHYLLRSPTYKARIKAVSTGVVESRLRLYTDEFYRLEALLPPLPEQAAMVRFLDHADRRIRRYIRAKQKLSELLEEQKQAIIHRAVTRGLDPNVRLKPSGVEWLGDVPEHWEIRRLKTLVRRIDQGVSPQAENYLADGDSWGVLKAGCVNRGVFRQEQHKRLPAGFGFDPLLAVKKGDVLVSRASGSPHLVGSVGRVVSLRYKLILSDKTFRPVFTNDVQPHFMVLAMNSLYYRRQVDSRLAAPKVWRTTSLCHPYVRSSSSFRLREIRTRSLQASER